MIMSGRPRKRTPKRLERIMDEVMRGKTLTAISGIKGMPSLTTIHRWMRDDEEFQREYSRAVAARCHVIILEALEIADRPKENSTEVSADRLRFDARLKVAGKLNPKSYGGKPVNEPAKEDKLDKVIVEIVRSGEDEHSDKSE
jgi:hypothetical protein